MTARHDAVVRAVAKALKRAGGLVLIEKRVLDTVRARPDLDVILEGRSYLIEVVAPYLQLSIVRHTRWSIIKP